MTEHSRRGVYSNTNAIEDFFRRKAAQVGFADVGARSVAGLDALMVSQQPTADIQSFREWALAENEAAEEWTARIDRAWERMTDYERADFENWFQLPDFVKDGDF